MRGQWIHELISFFLHPSYKIFKFFFNLCHSREAPKSNPQNPTKSVNSLFQDKPNPYLITNPKFLHKNPSNMSPKPRHQPAVWISLFVNFTNCNNICTSAKETPKVSPRPAQNNPNYNPSNSFGLFIKSIPIRTPNHYPQPALVFYLKMLHPYWNYSKKTQIEPFSPPPQSILKP